MDPVKDQQDRPSIMEKESDTKSLAESTPIVSLEDADETAIFYNANRHLVGPLTPDLRSKIVRKNFWALLSQTWWIAFLIHLDKSTLSQASTMGIFRDVHMSKKTYNDLFLVFYAGYLIALWPGAWLSQRIGHRVFIIGSLFFWALLIGLHCTVTTGPQMMALRFFLGMTESQIVPSTTVLHQAFFPPKKSPWVQLLWWAAGGLANVMLTMVAYKLIIDEGNVTLLHGLSSWKWLHIICAAVTFAIFVPLLLFLPNTPVDAKWLTRDEKVHTIAMIRETHAGVANRHFKWHHLRELYTDLKSWLFIFHMFFNELPNNTSQQLPLIVVGFGFTPAESALFNIVKPIWGSVLILVTAAMLYSTRLGVGYTCALSYIPCFIGGIIELASPWSNKVALVVGTQISTFKPSYLLGLSWAGTTTTGHTKRIALMSSCIVAASVANMISPEFWQPQYAPRYKLPWAFMTAFWFISPAMCLVIRWHLQKENRRRQALLAQGETKDGALGEGERGLHKVEQARLDLGNSEKLSIENEDLDLTDRENLRFVYPL
ncbi:allantoate permease of the major facilitator superfamily [Ceraceosorus bombacis]|uniref:Allantoate permease of the major facilitator superfamily n=1 Tax=Ceraceosorus bombacis TaxID=401625 RepID=A0A0P1BA38_9BASI|nr:allantoate permease of the major facilitator superfamily [Ceraceosorus bombacis]